MELEELEEGHQSTPNALEQRVVKNLTVSLKSDQTDLTLDSDQSLNDIPKSVEEPRSSIS